MSVAVPPPVSGARHLLAGYALLVRPGLRRFVVLPLLGNILIFSLAIWAAFWGLESTLERWLPEAVSWLRWLLYPLLAVVLVALGFFTFTLLANLLLAPFNGLLSAKVEWLVAGRAPAASGRGVLGEIGHTLGKEARRLGYVAIRLLGLLLLGLVPVVGLLAAPLAIVLGAWFLAMEFAANPLDNRGLDFATQRQFLRRHRWAWMSFGLSALGMALVPVVNFALVPAAVAGATTLTLQLRGQDDGG
ncbi:MAG TPA: sulfate transporter CysZ [Xanthomonadaceae bacterium]|nr:sulfate transporter CysZ [Xanthomonadaceae bacterium]